MLKIGDWVTQYRKGFWKIVDLKPKYAEEDYYDDKGNLHKKGELVSSWALMKKGFTPKMKFMLDSDVCDFKWCRLIPPDIAEEINKYFKEHPKDHDKFSSLPFIDHPAVSTSWLHLTSEQVTSFEKVIQELPIQFTQNYAMQCFEKHGLKECFSLPPANYRFVCWHTLWELDEDCNPLYKNPELKCD